MFVTEIVLKELTLTLMLLYLFFLRRGDMGRGGAEGGREGGREGERERERERERRKAERMRLTEKRGSGRDGVGRERGLGIPSQSEWKWVNPNSNPNPATRVFTMVSHFTGHFL